jgi:hypothetical protein
LKRPTFNVQRSTLNQNPLNRHVQSWGWTQDASFFVKKEKALIDNSIQAFTKILPRWCRSGDSPVPFRKGWMTVAAEFGFQ